MGVPFSGSIPSKKFQPNGLDTFFIVGLIAIMLHVLISGADYVQTKMLARTTPA